MSGVPEAPPHLPPPLGSVPPLLESAGGTPTLLPGMISEVLGPPPTVPPAPRLLQQNK